jgi:hypothetical protein
MKFLGPSNKETVYQIGPFTTEVEMLPVYVIVQLRAYGFGTYTNDNLPAMGIREAGVSIARQGDKEWIVKLNFYDGRELTEEEMKSIEEAVTDIQ